MNNTPLVAHLIYVLDYGGLETLLVETINRMPADKYRHVIICITGYTDFAKKINKPGVTLYSLGKGAGFGLRTHFILWKLLRRIRPTILHTYNLPAVEYAPAAALAGVPIRIHAEHGRDASDPNGENRKHNLLRRLLIPFIDCYVPVSGDLQQWLRTVIGVPDAKNRLIKNGVDTENFQPARKALFPPEASHLATDFIVIGTVGRVQDVKNHHGLVDAFIHLQELVPSMRAQLRLVIVGDGPLLHNLKKQISAAGLDDAVWLPGSRTDIAEIMQEFSIFALSSIAEGTPVVLLEAMSTGLPVVSTRVGGVPEVVIDNVTGALVSPSDPKAFAAAMAAYLRQPELAVRHGIAGRQRVMHHYSMEAMLSKYIELYDDLRERKTQIGEHVKSCVE
jgi:sugar transferase (PEP-CTERM/EpsH1 system associated)